METATGKISALNGRTATVIVTSASVCHRCAAGKGCGAGVFQAADKPRYMQIDIPDGMSVHAGDSIDLTIASRHLLRAALLAYGMPLLTMLGSLLAWQSFSTGPGDAGAILAAGAGLLAGHLIGRAWLAKESVCDQFVPSVVRSPDGNAS